MTAPKLTKKQKKALAFRERKGKGKAQASGPGLDDNDVPISENQDLAEMELPEVPDVAVEPREDSEKARGDRAGVVQGKKRKRDTRENAMAGEEPKAKKKRKSESDQGKDKESIAEGEEQSVEKPTKEKGKAKQKFILFVGNLKFTTTREQIQEHFAACDPPPTVRLMTPKASTLDKQLVKSKGFAFLEFTSRNALQQALKLHHSDLQGRKINVELTAGGGGKSDKRLAKVKERNKELHQQRIKRLEKQKSKDGEGHEIELERPQRYSATSGVEQIPLKKRTWSVPEGPEDEIKKRKRGSKSKKPARPLGTGVNAIPVG